MRHTIKFHMNTKNPWPIKTLAILACAAHGQDYCFCSPPPGCHLWPFSKPGMPHASSPELHMPSVTTMQRLQFWARDLRRPSEGLWGDTWPFTSLKAPEQVKQGESWKEAPPPEVWYSGTFPSEECKCFSIARGKAGAEDSRVDVMMNMQTYIHIYLVPI